MRGHSGPHIALFPSAVKFESIYVLWISTSNFELQHDVRGFARLP